VRWDSRISPWTTSPPGWRRWERFRQRSRTAVMYGFAPGMVGRSIPAAWALATPEQVLGINLAAANAALRRLLGAWVCPRRSQPKCRTGATGGGALRRGRPAIAAGLASLPWPAEPHLAILHGFTFLREYRGDSHVATLVAYGLDGCECHHLLLGAADAGCSCHAGFAAIGIEMLRRGTQATREWPDDEWQTGEDRRVTFPARDRLASLSPACSPVSHLTCSNRQTRQPVCAPPRRSEPRS
jgi:hypothetical protein